MAQKKSETQNKLDEQKMLLKISNYLMIGLELACIIKSVRMIKNYSIEIYNYLVPFFKMNTQLPLLIHLMVKCHQALTSLPSREKMDSSVRQVMARISYQTLILSLQNNESPFMKRLLLTERNVEKRKWRLVYSYETKYPELPEDQKEIFRIQEEKLKSGAPIPDSELIRLPEAVEERIVRALEVEREGGSFEEYLLSLGYVDVVYTQTEGWINRVDILRAYKVRSEDTDKIKKSLLELIDFWNVLKANPTQYLTQGAIQEDNPKYLELYCKGVRRVMEIGTMSRDEIIAILQKIKEPEELAGSVNNKISEKLDHLQKDIVRKQRLRFQILENKLKELEGNVS